MHTIQRYGFLWLRRRKIPLEIQLTPRCIVCCEHPDINLTEQIINRLTPIHRARPQAPQPYRTLMACHGHGQVHGTVATGTYAIVARSTQPA